MNPPCKEKMTECRKLISDYEATCTSIEAALREKLRLLAIARTYVDGAKGTIALVNKYPDCYFFGKALEIEIDLFKRMSYITLGESDIVFVRPDQKIGIWISGDVSCRE